MVDNVVAGMLTLFVSVLILCVNCCL